jgi:hypothetical protein
VAPSLGDCSFLGGAAAVQAPYDEQLRVLRVFEEVHPQHVPILRVIDQEPVDEDARWARSSRPRTAGSASRGR